LLDELAAHVGATWCFGAGVPEPLIDMLAEFDALLTNVSLAEAVPEACGENVIVKGTLVSGEMLAGNDTPLSENSLLLT
jgi:hypothetical protein